MATRQERPAPGIGLRIRRLRPRAQVPTEVLRRQVRIVYRQSPVGTVVTAIVATALGLAVMTPESRELELAWILASVLVAVLRFADSLAHRDPAMDPYRARRHVRTGALLQGLLWGVAGTFLLPAAPLHQMFLIAVISGMTAGAVLMLSPIWSAYALFAAPAIIPLCLMLLGGALPTQKLIGALGLVYSLTILFMAARTSRWLEDSLCSELENETLSRDLRSANQALKDYHARLEEAVVTRTLELSEANAQLRQEWAAKEAERRKAEEREEALRRTQKLESLGVLAGGIAHDFNNLLAAIMGNLNMLQVQTPPGAAAQAFLDNMEKAVNRAANLTRQMLAYSGKGHFSLQNVDLNQVVQELASLLEVCISKRASLHLELDPNLPPIYGDPGQLQQVVMNLVTNASEALAGRDGAIRITTCALDLDAAAAARVSRVVPTAPGPHVLLEVRDTGQGMEPQVLASIFDPFFTTKESGRGLGLSAMLGILRGHGAGIEILSEPGAGSTFRLCFPASTIAVDPQAPPDHAPAAAFTGQVLVVDDEPAILASARAMLESLGLRVATAGDGQQAMDHLARHGQDISLVLLDLTMPYMDGRQTLDALTRLRPDLPVILSSGYDPRQASPRVREFEGRTFLCKPYTLEQLQRALSAVPGLPGRDRVS